LDWKCPTSGTWQRFLTDPEGINRKPLQQHLQSCPYCTYFVSQLKQLYGDLLADVERPSGDPIVLYPWTESVDDMGAGQTLLAAQGGLEPGTESALVLTSADNQVLMRATRDSRTGQTWLYLMSEDPARYRNVLVQWFAGETSFITDENGRACLGNIPWPEPHTMTAEIRPPKASFSIVLSNDWPEAGQEIVLQSLDDLRLRVVVSRVGRGCRLQVEAVDWPQSVAPGSVMVAIRDSGDHSDTKIVPLTTDSIMHDCTDADSQIQIYIYR
jgi:hypothetical protein